MSTASIPTIARRGQKNFFYLALLDARGYRKAFPKHALILQLQIAECLLFALSATQKFSGLTIRTGNIARLPQSLKNWGSSDKCNCNTNISPTARHNKGYRRGMVCANGRGMFVLWRWRLPRVGGELRHHGRRRWYGRGGLRGRRGRGDCCGTFCGACSNADLTVPFFPSKRIVPHHNASIRNLRAYSFRISFAIHVPERRR